MSSLEWTEAYHYLPYGNRESHEIPRPHWELWVVGMDRDAWYNTPAATIERLSERKYELTIGRTERRFRSLKAAKAMGIALYRMDNDG